MSEFVIKLTTLIPIFTYEMEKRLSKLPVVIQWINRNTSNKPGLPLDHPQVSKPQAGQWWLLAAKRDMLPRVACARNAMAGKLPSLLKTAFWVWAETHVKDSWPEVVKVYSTWSMKHGPATCSQLFTCSNIGSLCEVYGLSRKMVCTAY